MLNLSTQAKLRLQENQKVLFKADFTLDKSYGRNASIPSTVLTLTGDDVMSGSATITDATSTSGSFDVGCAIIGSFNVTLNNFDDRFSFYDFTGAKMKVYVGVPLVDNVTDESDTTQVEWLSKGLYTVDKPTSIGNTIPLTMLDNMSKFERLFSDVNNISYPATLGTIVTEICRVCGVTIGTTIPNPSWQIQAPIKTENGKEVKYLDDGVTCLDIISYIAQINGCYARINNQGYLEFKWYDLASFSVDTSVNEDGGTFLTKTTPYSDGANIEGGSFDGSSENYVDEEGVSRVKYANPKDNYDGGTFSWGNYLVLQAFQSFSVGTDTIKITGIEFVVDNIDEKKTENTFTYLYDKNGVIADTETTRKSNAMEYCLSISENKLIPLLLKQEQCMSYVAKKICGLTFTPFNLTTLSNPQYEAGDPVRVISNKGDVYDTMITSLSYPLNGYETINCDAQSSNERKSIQSSPLSTAIASVKNDTNKKINVYDEAVHKLTQLNANALGFYTTTKEQADGSKIEYMHDKPTLEASLNAYMMSSTGFFIMQRERTTDAWISTGGVDMSANAVYRTLVADGIDANKINVSNLVVGSNVTMGDNAHISWSKVDSKPTDLAYIKDVSDAVSSSYVGVTTYYYGTYVSAGTARPSAPTINKDTHLYGHKAWDVWTTICPNPITTKNTEGNKEKYTNDTYFWMCPVYTTKSGTNSFGDVVEYNNSVATTVITQNSITTSFINALNITAKDFSADTISGKTINGSIFQSTPYDHGGGQGTYSDFVVDQWGNIKGSSISGSSISGSSISGGTITGSTISGNTISGASTFSMTAANSDHDTELNWGSTWGDSLTVVSNTNVDAGVGVCEKNHKFDRAVYVHSDDIRLYHYSYNPEYAQWGANQKSDKRLKKDIKDVNKTNIRNLFKDFIFKTFKYKKDDDRLHYGLIAQDVEKNLNNNNISTENYILKDKDGYYSLLYANLSRLNLIATQDLYEICDKQQQEIDLLKQEVELLKQQINKQ